MVISIAKENRAAAKRRTKRARETQRGVFRQVGGGGGRERSVVMWVSGGKRRDFWRDVVEEIDDG